MPPNGDIWGPELSDSTAIGRIVGVGNAGVDLSSSISSSSMFFSRDAGWTWRQIQAGNYLYEMADHAGLILAANYGAATDTVKYSWNEFFTSVDCKFTQTPMEIINIVINPKDVVQEFLVHGYRMKQGKERGVLVHFDFTNLHERQCTQDDYELWSPFDNKEDSEHCIMGQSVAYYRRLQLAECFNANATETESILKTCPCTRLDYECDACYYSQNETCVPDPACLVIAPPCVNGYMNVTKGYRLIPGNKCSGGLDLNPEQQSCESDVISGDPDPHHSSGSTAAVVVMIIVGLVGALVVGMWYLNRRTGFVRKHAFQRLPTRVRGLFDKGESTALDEDLLEAREPDASDEELETQSSDQKEESPEQLI
eukprot:TRINITY_DN6092_c0_g1_i3.p2 TRINITY_DN6092_c0_g1~~TRINITY_DN6092_c0_g1_i3.p2  ORF type:complete len:368 (-),score=65.08 TRINITY_DN6092_c0_g1_i3:53-1156(-)